MGWTGTLMINFSETEGADDWPTVRCAAVSLVHVCTFFACIQRRLQVPRVLRTQVGLNSKSPVLGFFFFFQLALEVTIQNYLDLGHIKDFDLPVLMCSQAVNLGVSLGDENLLPTVL